MKSMRETGMGVQDHGLILRRNPWLELDAERQPTSPIRETLILLFGAAVGMAIGVFITLVVFLG